MKDQLSAWHVTVTLNACLDWNHSTEPSLALFLSSILCWVINSYDKDMRVECPPLATTQLSLEHEEKLSG